jgi:hypothetical protein
MDLKETGWETVHMDSEEIGWEILTSSKYLTCGHDY